MRNRFPFFERNPIYKYLDSAATSQTLDTVIEDTQNFYFDHKSNAHRSGHKMGTWIDEKYFQSKSLIAHWLGLTSAENCIIFNSGSSQGLYDSVQLINSKHRNVSVFLGIDFHHSLFLPMTQLGWKVNYINILQNGKLDLEELKKKLSEDTAECKVIAVSAVSNVIGVVNDLDAIKSIAKETQSTTIVDASQLLSKRKTNLLGFDFVAWSWHKIYGPTGLGCLVIDEKWLDTAPIRPGGGSVVSVQLDNIDFQQSAARFESGTPNLAAIASLPRLVQWLVENESALIDHDIKLAQVANSLFNNKLYNVDSGLISLEVKAGTVEDYVMMLDAKDVYVRGGKLCAQPLIDSVSKNKSLLRISWGAYTTKEELEFTFKSIEDIHARLSRYV
jgi:cysteine desulfurase / selenocysteine lyase